MAMETLSKPQLWRGKLLSHVHLIKGPNTHAYEILEVPLMEKLETINMEYRIAKMRKQPQWNRIRQDVRSEKVLVNWMVRQNNGKLAKFAAHAITKNLATAKNLHRWFPSEHSGRCSSCGELEDGMHAIAGCTDRDWLTINPIKHWIAVLTTKELQIRFKTFMTSTGPAWWPKRPQCKGVLKEIPAWRTSITDDEQLHRMFLLPDCVADLH